MKIAILGTRGIPNQYGGFEQCAQYLSQGLQAKGHDVYVYSSSDHSFKEKIWQGVRLIHQYDPEKSIGTAGQFIYDFNCILNTRKHNFDLILQLGYTSSSIWSFLLPSKSVIITNMDGLEWKRSKFNTLTKMFLRCAEKLAIKSSDYLIADSVGIQNYILKKYNLSSYYIPYGAHVFDKPNKILLEEFGLKEYGYDIIIARLEPENNVEIILKGVISSKSNFPIIIIGNHSTKYGRFLKRKFLNDSRVKFLGPIYDINVLNNLRYYSNIYFHGHSVGGTNPSLLEAMASQSLICAHANEFNSSIVGSDAFYFKDHHSVKSYRDQLSKDAENLVKIKNNYEKIKNIYNWENIIQSYENVFSQSF